MAAANNGVYNQNGSANQAQGERYAAQTLPRVLHGAYPLHQGSLRDNFALAGGIPQGLQFQLPPKLVVQKGSPSNSQGEGAAGQGKPKIKRLADPSSSRTGSKTNTPVPIAPKAFPTDVLSHLAPSPQHATPSPELPAVSSTFGHPTVAPFAVPPPLNLAEHKQVQAVGAFRRRQPAAQFTPKSPPVPASPQAFNQPDPTGVVAQHWGTPVYPVQGNPYPSVPGGLPIPRPAAGAAGVAGPATWSHPGNQPYSWNNAGSMYMWQPAYSSGGHTHYGGQQEIVPSYQPPQIQQPQYPYMQYQPQTGLYEEVPEPSGQQEDGDYSGHEEAVAVSTPAPYSAEEHYVTQFGGAQDVPSGDTAHQASLPHRAPEAGPPSAVQASVQDTMHYTGYDAPAPLQHLRHKKSKKKEEDEKASEAGEKAKSEKPRGRPPISLLEMKCGKGALLKGRKSGAVRRKVNLLGEKLRSMMAELMSTPVVSMQTREMETALAVLLTLGVCGVDSRAVVELVDEGSLAETFREEGRRQVRAEADSQLRVGGGKRRRVVVQISDSTDSWPAGRFTMFTQPLSRNGKRGSTKVAETFKQSAWSAFKPQQGAGARNGAPQEAKSEAAEEEMRSEEGGEELAEQEGQQAGLEEEGSLSEGEGDEVSSENESRELECGGGFGDVSKGPLKPRLGAVCDSQLGEQVQYLQSDAEVPSSGTSFGQGAECLGDVELRGGYAGL